MRNINQLIWGILFIFFNIHTTLAQNKIAIDSLLQLSKHEISTKEKVDVYVKIAKEYYTSDSLNATKYANEAIKLAEEIKYKEGKIDGLQVIAVVNAILGNYSKAIPLFEEVVNQADNAKYLRGKLYGLNGLGNISKFQGEYEKALNYLFQALSVANKLGDKRGAVTCFNNIGIIYKNQGYYKEALEYYFQSLAILEKIGEKQGVSYLYGNIGIIYDLQKSYSEALNNYLKSLKIKEEIGDKKGMAISYTNIGNVYREQNNNTKALDYFLKSLEVLKGFNDKKQIAGNYIHIGSIYKDQKKYKKALDYAQKAKLINETIGDKDNIPGNLLLIGQIHREQGNYKLSKEFTNEAYALSVEIGHIENIKDVAKELSLIEKELANFEAAYDAHVLFKQMADSLQNEELTKKITRLEAEYDFQQEKDSIQFANQTERLLLEKKISNRKNIQLASFITLGLLAILVVILFRFFQIKSRSNKLLTEKTQLLKIANEEVNAQKSEISLQNEQLQDLNAIKDRVFSIIAHDLRSPINSLQGVMMLFKSDYDLSKEEIKEYFERLSVNVEGVASLLSNLLYWARSQMQGSLAINPTSIELSTYIKEVTKLLSEAALNKKIETKVEIQDGLPKLFVDSEILRFLLRNLLNNAYKFSYPESTVSIYAKVAENNFIKVSIKDSGIGMDDITKRSLFKGLVQSQNGTQSEKGTGLGLMLCQEFIEKTGGSIGVESEPRDGSTFWFVIPAATEKVPLK